MKIPLNGKWRYKVDSNNRGKKERWGDSNWIMERYNSLNEIVLPNNWNNLTKLEKYEGIVWFFLKFELKDEVVNLISKNDLFIQFKAVNYHTHLWINGVDCGIHEGNFVPFKFRVRSTVFRIHQENYIAVYVENFRRKKRIPTKSRDWFNWGGIYRDINLLILKKNRINWTGVRTKIHEGGKAEVQVYFKLHFISGSEKKNLEIRWELFLMGNISSENNQTDGPILQDSSNFIPEFTRKKQSFRFRVNDPKLWSYNDPNLYLLKLYLPKSHEAYEIRFGIREIKGIGSNLYLNGNRISLKGVNLHEEFFSYGRAIPREERLKDVKNIKKLGFNALRTGHYPYDESMYDICDEEGLLVLEEIPVYWGIDFSDSKILSLALDLLSKMIHRDINHPSIVLWSVGNEIPISNKSCWHFIRELLKFARDLDDSRLITCVLDVWMSLTTSKEIIRELDILCINQYIGWYYFSVNNLNIFLDCLNMLHKKPILVTEFGAGAQYGYHDHSNLPAKYSEERQVSILEYSIKVMNSKQYIKGWFIWIYRDFRSHMRLNKYQEGYNRKGIVNQLNNPKMIAQRMPFIINLEITEIKHHKIRAVIFYIAFFPLIKLIAMIVSVILGKFSDRGDDYYYSTIID